MQKETRLKTKRLLLVPMTRQELEQTIAREENPELKQTYGEMLAGVDADPGNALWNTPWAMRLKKEGTCIGDLGFKGRAKSVRHKERRAWSALSWTEYILRTLP